MIPSKAKKVQIDLSIVDNQRIKGLNQKYFSNQEPTDVIAFNLNEKLPNGIFLLGELVLSYPQIKKQAKAYGVSEAEEMARVIAHGVLHLLGFEDKTAKNRLEMKKIEDQVAQSLVKKEPPEGKRG